MYLGIHQLLHRHLQKQELPRPRHRPQRGGRSRLPLLLVVLMDRGYDRKSPLPGPNSLVVEADKQFLFLALLFDVVREVPHPKHPVLRAPQAG